MSFKYDQVLDILRDFKHLSSKRRRKFMTTLFYDESFMKWLFQPEKDPNLAEKVEDIYEEFTKEPAMKAMIDAIEYEGHHEFNRSHATFLTTVANIAIDNCNALVSETKEKQRSGEYSRRDASMVLDDVTDIEDVVAKLLKRARKIVKKDAFMMSKRYRLPIYITMSALTSIPDPKYIDRYKIGYYLNNLFNTIYSDVDENGEFQKGVKWRDFFRDVFGKNNVIEAATFILLEGVHRINKYENSRDVRTCWDTLTSFALNELENAPEQLRNQMIELYIKRIDKMFTSKAFDLRVNLLDLDEMLFPELIKTVGKYAVKIKEILSRGIK